MLLKNKRGWHLTPRFLTQLILFLAIAIGLIAIFVAIKGKLFS